MCIDLHLNTKHSCQILMNLELSLLIFQNIQISNFMKIRPVGAELFRAVRQTDRRTDIKKANSQVSQSLRQR